MMNRGWVKLYRETTDNVVWTSTTPEQKVIFLAILMMVNHSANSWEWEGEKFHVEPGQTITSLDSICELAGKGITPQKVRTALKKFEKWGILTNKSTKTGRLITLINWGKYQRETGNLTNLLTDEQQTANRQLTAIKECKNEKMKEVVHSPTFDDMKGSKEDATSKDIVDLYYRLFNENTGSEPLKNYAKDCSIIKSSGVADLDSDEVKEKLRNWFKAADIFTVNKLYPLKLFVTQYNQVTADKMLYPTNNRVYPEHEILNDLPRYKDLTNDPDLKKDTGY